MTQSDGLFTVRGESDNVRPDMEFDIVTVSHLFRKTAE
uniref:Uncharacterized protein n=1 Tax=Escherichia coli TaxID=562 RepID=A0A7U1E294_ECOLX|nr:hypothetical protein [Escherichia coli]